MVGANQSEIVEKCRNSLVSNADALNAMLLENIPVDFLERLPAPTRGPQRNINTSFEIMAVRGKRFLVCLFLH